MPWADGETVFAEVKLSLGQGHRAGSGTPVEVEAIIVDQEQNEELCAKVEHSFRVLKYRFGDAKPRYRGLTQEPGASVRVLCVRQPILPCEESRWYEVESKLTQRPKTRGTSPSWWLWGLVVSSCDRIGTTEATVQTFLKPKLTSSAV